MTEEQTTSGVSEEQAAKCMDLEKQVVELINDVAGEQKIPLHLTTWVVARILGVCLMSYPGGPAEKSRMLYGALRTMLRPLVDQFDMAQGNEVLLLLAAVLDNYAEDATIEAMTSTVVQAFRAADEAEAELEDGATVN